MSGNIDKSPLLDEELYNRIKNMNQDQLEALVNNIYVQGKNDAYEEFDSVVDALEGASKKFFEKLQNEISQIEDIDECKSKQIINIIKKTIDNM